MQLKTFLISGFLLWTCLACRPGASLPTTAPGPQIRFGSGGGITGAVTTYYLLENGRLYQHTSSPDTMVFIQRLSADKRRAYFERIEALNLPTKAVMQPGDLYRFLEYRTNTDSTRATWGAPGVKVSEDMRRLYQDLMQHIHPEE